MMNAILFLLIVLTSAIVAATLSTNLLADWAIARKRMKWRKENVGGLSPEKVAEKTRERNDVIRALAIKLIGFPGCNECDLSTMLVDDVELCDFLLQLKQNGVFLRAVDKGRLHPFKGCVEVDKKDGTVCISRNATPITIRRFFGLTSNGSKAVCDTVINNDNNGLTDVELRIALKKTEDNVQFCRTNQGQLQESIAEIEMVSASDKNDATTNSKMLGTLWTSLAAEEKKEKELLTRKAKIEDHIAQIAVCRDRLKKYRKARETVIRCNNNGVEDIDKQIGAALQTGYALQRACREIADTSDAMVGETELAQEYLTETPETTAQAVDNQAEETFSTPDEQLSTKRDRGRTMIIN